MNIRLNFTRIAPEAYQPMVAMEKYFMNCGLDHGLIHLVKLRASQINGCAYCIDVHWKDARAAGETEQRLYGLDAWAESPYYNDRERAALTWTESLTRVGEGHVPNEVYELLRSQFSEKETVDLSWVIAIINAWNRMAISLRSPAGSYKPHPTA